ncbi:MAG: ABC transporter ATP-binding protein/permease [Oscillospiraceae bacterium]|nr:ABC transporter ATP-binding protein/permease [Oscillospiraceae bacterium]
MTVTKSEHKDNFISTNIRGIKLVFKWRKWLIPSIILSALFGSLSPYVTIYMSAEILNELAGAKNIQRLTFLVLFTVIANLLIVIIGRLFNKLKEYERQMFANDESRMFTEFGFNMDYEHLENPEIRKYRRKIDENKQMNLFGIWELLHSFQYVAEGIIQIILSVCFTSSLFVLIFMQSKDMFGAVIFPIAIVLLVALSIFISMKNSKKLSKLGDDITDTQVELNRLGGGILGEDDYHTGKYVRLYNMLIIFQKYREQSIKILTNGNKRYWFGWRNTQIPDQIISQGLNFTIYAFVCLNAVRGLFAIGGVIKYIGFISMLVNAFKGMSAHIALLKMNIPFLAHYLNFFEIENKMYQGTLPIEKCNDNEYEFEFHNVSLKYPGSERYVLKNLSMKLRIGQKLAVVGMNGSGKTTMIKLLCRMYDPSDGEITLNGIDVKKYDYDEYMSIFSVVFQDFKLFSFTLGQNVAASVDVDGQKAEKCLSMAGLSERLQSMPKGLETPLYKDFDDDGVEISGGEAQKIALARALYKDAPFIVLDEPTAALDPIAEFEVYSKFNEIVGGKTAIYISHRLSSCRFCDDIAVFHEGELIQRGSHDVLIADEGGKYYELWNAQAQYYNENNETGLSDRMIQ